MGRVRGRCGVSRAGDYEKARATQPLPADRSVDEHELTPTPHHLLPPPHAPILIFPANMSSAAYKALEVSTAHISPLCGLCADELVLLAVAAHVGDGLHPAHPDNLPPLARRSDPLRSLRLHLLLHHVSTDSSFFLVLATLVLISFPLSFPD